MSHTEHHITSLKTLSIVFGALVFLTVFTVFTAQFDLGAFNVPLALAIALTKASLVVLIFMALIWDNKVNAVILAVGCLFVVVFISFILLDTEYRGDLSNTF
ncbi:MAG: cytochrome C oxidase subunit IV family protein, partial [Bacteroidetes bacterium]|nr:cytochrome C oxidase subunit IV family protein [Bacteroidota bacterium]